MLSKKNEISNSHLDLSRAGGHAATMGNYHVGAERGN
jgi:hypothetical protein